MVITAKECGCPNGGWKSIELSILCGGTVFLVLLVCVTVCWLWTVGLCKTVRPSIKLPTHISFHGAGEQLRTEEHFPWKEKGLDSVDSDAYMADVQYTVLLGQSKAFVSCRVPRLKIWQSFWPSSRAHFCYSSQPRAFWKARVASFWEKLFWMEHRETWFQEVLISS